MAEQIAYLIDCMEYMRTLPDNAFDIAVVDPPYGDAGQFFKRTDGSRFDGKFDKYRSQNSNVERETEANRSITASVDGLTDTKQVTRTGGTWAEKFGKKIIAWDTAPGENYFSELFRVSRRQIIWGGNYFSLPPTRCFLIWRKTNIPENFTMAMCEYAWCSFNGNAKLFECMSQNQKGRFHPTQKPVELYKWIFSRYVQQGERILDTHLGSGSSRIAAHELGFDFVGCEIDKEYFDKQEKRFNDFVNQQSLFY